MSGVDFVVPFRPLSVQAKDRQRLQDWKQTVVYCALRSYSGVPFATGELHVSVVFLCDESAPIDVDNIIKPILDALHSVVYINDVLVTDVDAHRRFIGDLLDATGCSPELIKMIRSGEESVYVRIQQADSLGAHL